MQDKSPCVDGVPLRVAASFNYGRCRPEAEIRLNFVAATAESARLRNLTIRQFVHLGLCGTLQLMPHEQPVRAQYRSGMPQKVRRRHGYKL